MRSLLLALLLTLAVAQPALADDGGGFRRTTPRGALATANGVLVIGVPGGRAWGVESGLRPLPAAGTVLVVRLEVRDPLVREAFVRVAYYAKATGRTRQLATADSEAVPAGERAWVSVEIDPPAGAVAYRVRVLARLRAPDARSAADAIRATLGGPRDRSALFGSLYSRLLP